MATVLVSIPNGKQKMTTKLPWRLPIHDQYDIFNTKNWNVWQYASNITFTSRGNQKATFEKIQLGALQYLISYPFYLFLKLDYLSSLQLNLKIKLCVYTKIQHPTTKTFLQFVIIKWKSRKVVSFVHQLYQSLQVTVPVHSLDCLVVH